MDNEQNKQFFFNTYLDCILTTVVQICSSNIENINNIFDEVECPCKVIGKVVKICSKNENIHLLRKTGQPLFYENLLNCCCDIGNNLNDSGIILPSQPKFKIEGETILIIPISVCI